MKENISKEEAKTVARRALLRAGWTLPVIAATPLLNTASAMSAVDCANLQAKLSKHVASGDYESANNILIKIIDNGCTIN